MFKGLNQQEVESTVSALGSLVGGQLQQVLSCERGIGLGLYHRGRMSWIFLDLSPAAPALLVLDQWPSAQKKKTKPLQLFLRSHFEDHKFIGAKVLVEYGRVVELSFSGDCFLEVRLFPHGVNAIARTPDKQISWAKVNDLVRVESGGQDRCRSLEDITQEWLGAQLKPQKTRALSNDLKKKQKALQILGEELSSDEETSWRKLGEWLKTNQTLDVPEEWRKRVDPELDLAANIVRAFEKAEKWALKQEGRLQRQESLRSEIERLKDPNGAPPPEPNPDNLLRLAEGKGRRHQLEEGLELYIGKSAKDNLALLRRANPWDFWLHLRDYPGAHGILRRSRGKVISDSLLGEAARKVAQASITSKKQLQKGDRLDVVIAECRHVRPVKGGSIGSVTFRNERVLTIRL